VLTGSRWSTGHTGAGRLSRTEVGMKSAPRFDRKMGVPACESRYFVGDGRFELLIKLYVSAALPRPTSTKIGCTSCRIRRREGFCTTCPR